MGISQHRDLSCCHNAFGCKRRGSGLGELHANEDRGEPHTYIYIYTRGATSVINFQTLPTSEVPLHGLPNCKYPG